MRRLMMLAMLPVLGGLFWAVACERDDYRDVLPLRPLGDAAVASPDLAAVPDLARPADLNRPVDMGLPPDMTVPPDMTLPPDMTTPPDMTVTDL